MRRKQSFLLRTFLLLQGSPYKTLLWACAARTCGYLCRVVPARTLRVYATRTRGYLCREVPAKPICRVASRPCTPGSISYREEKSETSSTQTKGAPKTSWFLDFQRRGSCLTPFEPPYSQESYDNDVTTCCPKRQVQNLTSSRWRSRQGERTSLCEVPEGVSLLCKSSENGLCPFSGSHTKK